MRAPKNIQSELTSEDRQARIDAIAKEVKAKAIASQEKAFDLHTEDIISKLLAGGAKEWNGGANRRLYLTEAQKLEILGLSGVKNATRHGDKISNSQAQKLMMQAGDRNFYFDVVTNGWSDFAKKII
jgi:hypothetical protein